MQWYAAMLVEYCMCFSSSLGGRAYRTTNVPNNPKPSTLKPHPEALKPQGKTTKNTTGPQAEDEPMPEEPTPAAEGAAPMDTSG